MKGREEKKMEWSDGGGKWMCIYMYMRVGDENVRVYVFVERMVECMFLCKCEEICFSLIILFLIFGILVYLYDINY